MAQNELRYQKFSEGFKRKICEEYLTSNSSKSDLQLKYGLGGKSAISNWLKAFGHEDIKVRYLDTPIPVALPPKKKSDQPEKELTPEQRIKQLERQLEDEKLRSLAYKRMLEIAEQELKVPIKKKPFTK